MTDPAILTFLGMSGLVIALAYVSLRYVGNWQMRQTRGRRMRILEALYVGRDRQILLVKVGEEVLMLGSSPAGVSLVHRLPEEAVAAMAAEQTDAAVFQPGQPENLFSQLRQLGAALLQPKRRGAGSGQQPQSGLPASAADTNLESSIRNSLGKMRSLLRKESGDHSDSWGPL